MRNIRREAGLEWENQEFIFGHVSFEKPIDIHRAVEDQNLKFKGKV